MRRRHAIRGMDEIERAALAQLEPWCSSARASAARRLGMSRRAISRLDLRSGQSHLKVSSATLFAKFYSRDRFITGPSKGVGSLIGYITQAILRPCATGTASILRETLPWHVRYAGFSGSLPNITSLTVHAIGFLPMEGTVRYLPSEEHRSKAWIITFNRDVATWRLTSAEISGTVPTDCFGAEGSLGLTGGQSNIEVSRRASFARTRCR